MKNNDEERSRRYPIEEHMRWQILEWKIQRVGYVCLFTVVLLGACGLFSKGVLSDRKTVSDDGALQVEYERFGRLDSDMTMTIRIRPLHKHFTLLISGEEMDNFQIQSLQPQPQRAASSKNRLELSWDAAGNSAESTVWIGFEAQKPGRYPVTVSLDNQTSVHFTQWIYP